MNTILLTFLVSAGLAFLLGILLGFFKKIFFVPVDPTVEKIRECLPGANCGGCGYPGCDGFAAACAAGKAPADGCAAGGPEVAKQVGAVLGVEVKAVKYSAILACRGSKTCAQPKGFYNGVKSCAATKTMGINGTKMCNFGCIGFGDCAAACKFGAITIGEDGLPVFDDSKCTGCGACAAACPQHLILRVPEDQKGPLALCSNRNPNKAAILKQCKNGCIKCGKCERTCKEGAIKLENGIPVVDYSKCNQCGDCVNGCPTHVLSMRSGQGTFAALS